MYQKLLYLCTRVHFSVEKRKSKDASHRRFASFAPSTTIPAHLCKDGLRHIHPDSKQARSITVREAARLQSFPDDYEFIGPYTDQYKMIGNAVPPEFVRRLAIAVYKALFKSKVR